MRLRDSRTGELHELHPGPDGTIGMYVCGPTVYGRIHVGNARPFVIFGLMKRYLEWRGQPVTLVENITDVNDKIYTAAQAQGIASADLAREMAAAYIADTDRLGIGRPDREPLASETLDEIVALISELVASGHAYEADGDVYFAVRSFAAIRRALRPAARTICAPARGSSRASTSATRSTSRCGRPPSPGRTRAGPRRGATAARGGTSSARRWPRSCSGRGSRCTEAAAT